MRVSRSAKLWALPLSALEAEAVASGRQHQVRLPIEPKHSSLKSGLWSKVDWASAKAEESHVSVRIQTRSGRRTDRIFCRYRAGDLMWIKAAGFTRGTASQTLGIVRLHAHRLQWISEVSAGESGDFGARLPGRTLQVIYRELLGRLTKRALAHWLASELHAETYSRPPNFRDLFALQWEGVHGFGSWDANPWVWALTCESFWTPPLAVLRLRNDPKLQPERIS